MDWRARPPVRSAALFLAALVLAARAGAATAPGDSVTTPALPESAAAVSPAPAASPPPAPAFRPAEWETLSAGLPEAAHLTPLFKFRYNRVDGPALLLGAAVRSEREPRPLLYASAGYAFSREGFLYDVGFEAPIGDPARFRVGGAAFKNTGSEDGWIVGETENTLFALFARTDYRDYYETQGWNAFAAWEPGRDFALRAGWSLEDVGSLETETSFSVFGNKDHFRDNPSVGAFRMSAETFGARVGPATIPAEGGSNAELTYEHAPSPFEGDVEYSRFRGAAHTKVKLSTRQEARARLIGGTTVDGSLPDLKLWHLGGIGTLRGQEYKKFDGDQFLLANAEYYLLARKNVWAFGFLDWGAAWFGQGEIDNQRFSLDGGVGIRLGPGPCAITLARNLQASDAPFLVGVRLGGSF